MTDEQQARALLTRAAELPDDIQPPIARLVEVARRRRRLQVALSLVSVAALTAAGITLPAALRGPGSVAIPIRLGHPPPRGATAAELSHARWSALPPSPLGQRSNPILAWTGSRLLEFGGIRNGVIQRDGAAFEPARRRWQRIARVPESVGLRNAVSVWTGPASQQLFVTSGKVAGLYDPAANRWTTTELPRQLAGLALAAPAWTGHDVVLAGTSGSPVRPRLAVAAYSVATRSWQMITPHLPRRHPADGVALVATWHRVILWSLWSRDITFRNGSGTIRSGIDVLALRHGQWAAITGHWPQHRVVEDPAFASFRILIPPGQFWCGVCPAPFSESPAKLADAGTLALTTIPDGPLVTVPLIQPPLWLWNGSTVLAANESGYDRAAANGRLGRLAAYDPWSRHWHVLPDAPGRPALAAAPIFARQQLLVLTLSGDLLALGKRS